MSTIEDCGALSVEPFFDDTGHTLVLSSSSIK